MNNRVSKLPIYLELPERFCFVPIQFGVGNRSRRVYGVVLRILRYSKNSTAFTKLKFKVSCYKTKWFVDRTEFISPFILTGNLDVFLQKMAEFSLGNDYRSVYDSERYNLFPPLRELSWGSRDQPFWYGWHEFLIKLSTTAIFQFSKVFLLNGFISPFDAAIHLDIWNTLILE